MKIAIDAMGDSNAPDHVVIGAAKALEEHPVGINIQPRGDSTTMRQVGSKHAGSAERLETFHISEVNEVDEPAIQALLQKQPSGAIRGFHSHENNQGRTSAGKNCATGSHAGSSQFAAPAAGSHPLPTASGMSIHIMSSGAAALKVTESFFDLLKKRNFLNDFVRSLNYEVVAGNPRLGVNRNVVGGHGASCPEAIKNMILLANRMATINFYRKLKVAFGD